MIFTIEIKNIQHIKNFKFEINLNNNKLICLVGKNGIGKTTIIRAIRNLYSADTFSTTASPFVFSNESEIIYTLGDETLAYSYNSTVKSLDYKGKPLQFSAKELFVELPVPNGSRFYQFQKISSVDKELRQAINTNSSQRAVGLIGFLEKIYQTNKFEALQEVKIGRDYYYFIKQDNNHYIREDYFSSGEFFVIQIYKMIQQHKKLIVIDELDISLDADAQKRLLALLSEICTQEQVNILFTTHSLTLMRMLDEKNNLLYFLEEHTDKLEAKQRSYHYIKSSLFEFVGWDRYILTEDIVLRDYLEYLIDKVSPTFHQVKVIYIGGGDQVVDLMLRNRKDCCLCESHEALICILDGDQRGKKHVIKHNNVHCIPFESIEKSLYEYYLRDEKTFDRFDFGNSNDHPKKLYKHLITPQYEDGIPSTIMTKIELFDYLNTKQAEDVETLSIILKRFLSQ